MISCAHLKINVIPTTNFSKNHNSLYLICQCNYNLYCMNLGNLYVCTFSCVKWVRIEKFNSNCACVLHEIQRANNIAILISHMLTWVSCFIMRLNHYSPVVCFARSFWPIENQLKHMVCVEASSKCVIYFCYYKWMSVIC